MRKPDTYLRMALWIVPVFLAWHLTVNNVLLPIVSSAADTWVYFAYSELDAHLVYDTKWKITTRLFVASKPWSNNSFAPQLKTSGFSTVSIGNLKGFTLGLPLYWLFALSLSQKIVRIVMGSAVLLGVATIAIIFRIALQINHTLESDELLRVLTTTGYILVPPEPADFALLKPLRDVSTMCAIVVAPLLLVLINQHDS